MGISNWRSGVSGSQSPTSRLQSPLTISLFFFVIALLARVAAVGRYVTPDEPIWILRSLNFRQTLLAGDWAATIQSGHPGVILTWLGAVSIQFQLWLQPLSRQHLVWLDQLYWLSPENGLAFQHLSAFLTAARLGPILLTSLAIVLVYWLIRSRFDEATAAIAAVFLIADPFTAGLSGLFHLDALLSTFMLLAVLFLLPAPQQAAPTITPRQALLSGLFTALAVLTKTPGLFLLLFISLIILWRTVFQPPTVSTFSARLRRLPIPLFLWAGTTLLVILLLLPAVWAAPTAVFETVSGLANRLADSAVRPIFFLGQETLNPGPAFYPLVLAFRLSPVVCLGLLFAAVFAFAGRYKKLPAANLLWLLLFSLAFLFFLNLSAKRFDRYALPAILPLILIAAVGLKTAVTAVRSPKLSFALLLAFVIIQSLYYQTFSPFHLTAYNWLAGGPAAAQKVFTIGWGEETSATAKWVADHLLENPDQTLFTSNIPAAAAFYPGRLLPLQTAALSRLQNDDFLHFLPQDWQITTRTPNQPLSSFDTAQQALIQERGVTNLEEDQLFLDLEPADLNLIPFQNTPIQLHFEEKISITSAGALPAAWPNPILVGITWQRQQTGETDYFYRLEIADQAGESWLSQEGILLNAVDHQLRYWPIGQPQERFYTLFPPPDLAPGTYTVQLTLFDDQGAGLGAFTGDGRFAGLTASLATFIIPAPLDQLPPEPPHPINAGVELIGRDLLPATIETGLPLKIDLWWRQLPQTPPTGRLQLSVGDEPVTYPLTTTGWVPGQYYRLRPSWPVPPGLDSGSYQLTLQWLDENGRPQWPAPIDLGRIEIVARSRAFTLPPTLTPLQVRLGSVAYLQQAEVELTDSFINLSIIWQALEPDGIFYTTFVHLIAENGVTITQADRPPLEPTNSWVSGQVIQEQYQLPRPAPGRYTIAIGLYTQNNGLRLPAYFPDGTPLPKDQFIIEVLVP